jgi:hypothetical protein
VEDSGASFDEVLPVDVGRSMVSDAFGAKLKPRRIRASSSGLDVEGVRELPLDQIEAAFWNGQKEPHVVVADRAGQRLTIHVRSPEQAERLLKALRFTTTEKNAVFRVLPPFHLPTIGGMLFPFGAIVFFVFAKHNLNAVPEILIALVAMIVILGLGIFDRKLTVGRDGITISSRWGRRFVSFADVTSVNRYSDVQAPRRGRRGNEVIYAGVVLHLRGEDLRVPITRGLQPDDELFGACERINAALTAWRATQPVNTDVLERGGRTTQDWVSDLRTLGTTDPTTYRVAAVDREALFAIVEDPVNEASSRAAAAIAIGAKLDEESRVRLRKSAEAIADPKLRVAIEHVVDAKEEAFAELLDELAPAETKART